ncbi:MAG TPA: hypothetical protein VKY24_22115 [Reyranella sp.]|nr:hypothetical protein [Reyranella sp.]
MPNGCRSSALLPPPGVDHTVFAPFMIRFRPFIACHDSRKMPSFRDFGASMVRNPD